MLFSRKERKGRKEMKERSRLIHDFALFAFFAAKKIYPFSIESEQKGNDNEIGT